MGARLLWEQETVMLFSAPPRARSTPRCPNTQARGMRLEARETSGFDFETSSLIAQASCLTR